MSGYDQRMLWCQVDMIRGCSGPGRIGGRSGGGGFAQQILWCQVDLIGGCSCQTKMWLEDAPTLSGKTQKMLQSYVNMITRYSHPRWI